MLEILNLRERYLDRGIDLAQQYSVFRQPGSSQLKNFHGTLDEAVFRTYGFSRDEDNLAQLLALNHDLSSSPESTRGPGYHGLGDLRLSDMKVAPPIS